MQVSVLGSFGFSAADGSRPLLSGGSQRLLAFLALRTDAVTRTSRQGRYGQTRPGQHAYSSLRSALSRLGATTHDAVAVTDIDLRLAGDVVVDIRESQGVARRLLEPEATADVDALGAKVISVLSRDLLPDWYDDWVVPEAEEWRQLRLHALEALSERLTTVGRFAHAMGAALAAVRVEPLRESANAAVIACTWRRATEPTRCVSSGVTTALLQRELRAEPTTDLFELVGVAPSQSRRCRHRPAVRSGPRLASLLADSHVS